MRLWPLLFASPLPECRLRDNEPLVVTGTAAWLLAHPDPDTKQEMIDDHRRPALAPQPDLYPRRLVGTPPAALPATA